MAHQPRTRAKSIALPQKDIIPNVVIMVGPPGSGKSSQARKLVGAFNFHLICAGELLLIEISNPKCANKELIEQCMSNGTMVPASIMLPLIISAVDGRKAPNIIIDGFPRNKESAELWEAETKGRVITTLVLVFECSLKCCIERSEKSTNRENETLLLIEKRIETFVKESLPVIQHFKARNVVQTIDGTPTEDEVFDQLYKIFEELDAEKRK